MTNTRIRKLRARMKEVSLDAMLVTAPPNIRYLTGFSGSNGLAVVTAHRAEYPEGGANKSDCPNSPHSRSVARDRSLPRETCARLLADESRSRTANRLDSPKVR